MEGRQHACNYIQSCMQDTYYVSRREHQKEGTEDEVEVGGVGSVWERETDQERSPEEAEIFSEF